MYIKKKSICLLSSQNISTVNCLIFVFFPLYGSSWAFLGKESACNVGDLSSIAGLGRFPGEENGYPLQYSCLENSMDREAWQATVHGIAKSWTLLSN